MAKNGGKSEKATFAAGCFWGVEELFRTAPGVKATMAGYTGGHAKNPTYEQVCSNATGHAEAVQLEFDPDETSYARLLEIFWGNHDPTTPNRQGPDFGSQYRSAIFFHSKEQEKQARKMLSELEKSGRFHGKIVTQIEPAGEFWKAEEYHQKYEQRHGGGIGCAVHAVKDSARGKSGRITYLAAAALVALSFLASILIYPQLPEKMATHWGFGGEVNGYSGKDVGAFLVPVLALFLYGLFSVLPKLDPLKENYQMFAREYGLMVAAIIGFLAYIHLLMLAYNTGTDFNFGQLLAPAFAVLFFFMGGVMEKTKQNWFVGIRTPWTLSSERVWEKTHRIGGKVFKAAGIVALVGIAMPDFGLIAMVGAAVAGSLFCVVYSYLEYRKEKSGN